jgi:UDPglucose 6-dehydrogenase
MRIGVYGCGYLGTVLSACLADFGMPITCYGEDQERINALAQGNFPFYEKNLNDVVRRNLRVGRLVCSTDLESFCRRSQVIYIAEDDAEQVPRGFVEVLKRAQPETVLVITTPVAVGTAARLQQMLRKTNPTPQVTIVSQPLFFTDGCAVEDFNWPDRIVLGTDSHNAVNVLKQIYRPLVMRGVPVIVTSYETAELVREASSAFLATKVSFINELASLCEHVKADAVDLALAMGLDKKIAPRCLQAGASYGGPFAEADIASLAQLADQNGIALKILASAREVNRSVCDVVVSKVSALVESVSGKEVGVLGLAFKPHTSSVVGSISLDIVRRLNSSGAHVRAYDPVAMPDAKSKLDSTVRYCQDAYATAEGADALVLCTGWPEFRTLDFERIKRSLRQPVIVDTKNLLDAVRLKQLGFKYLGVGRA